MKIYNPIIWGIYKDHNIQLTQFNYETGQCDKFFETTNLVEDIQDWLSSGLLQFPEKVYLKNKSKTYNNLLVSDDKDFLSLISFLENNDKTKKVEYFNSTFSHHKALCIDAYNKVPAIFSPTTVVSIGKERDCEFITALQYVDGKITKEYHPRWVGMWEPFLHCIANSCPRLIKDDTPTENWIERLMSFQKSPDAFEESSDKKKNYKAMLRNVPDFLQWKKNNYKNQQNPIEDKINVNKERINVYLNAEEELLTIAYAKAATEESIIEFFKGSDPVIKEMIETSNMVIVTGEISKYVKLFSKISYNDKKIVLVQSADVATGLCLKDQIRKNVIKPKTNEHYKTYFDFSGEEKYIPSDINAMWTKGRVIMYLRKNKSAYIFCQKQKVSKVYDPNINGTYVACVRQNLSAYVFKHFLAGNVSDFLPLKKEILKDGVICFDFRIEDLFTRFLSNMNKLNVKAIDSNVCGYVKKFQSEKEVLHFARKHDAVILFEGSENTYEF